MGLEGKQPLQHQRLHNPPTASRGGDLRGQRPRHPWSGDGDLPGQRPRHPRPVGGDLRGQRPRHPG